VLVSETMLQQTQVPRVVRRYEAFMATFPTVQACAAATVADVVRAWNGLGFNRRAVSLHRCAQAVVADHGGHIPDDLRCLQALPGVGPYTARAILVFAFERDIGLVDTNAGRFLARAAAGRPLAPREAQALADQLVPRGQGWAWGQAVFDLGALVCTRRAPACDGCPIRGSCAWAASGFAGDDPIGSSAGISAPQSPFATSDRRGRGRLVTALRRGPVRAADLAAVMGWPDEPDRARRVADSVVRDGLAVRERSRYSLSR
jgi:A/G-specific adenine glycosylase